MDLLTILMVQLGIVTSYRVFFVSMGLKIQICLGWPASFNSIDNTTFTSACWWCSVASCELESGL